MPKKILIVDDNAINRQMLIHVLHTDYDIIEAQNGREAIELMLGEYKTLSAVLMDIVMPEMDGYEALRIARENPLLLQMPIIVVTGAEDEESRVKALLLGANDFISKPFNPEIVKHCVRNNIILHETAVVLNAMQKDRLTGLYTREAFFEMAQSRIGEGAPGQYILCCLDIDKFKLINDRYGAVEGDRILREIGNALKLCTDEVGGIAGRITADNFVALIPSDCSDTALFKKIREKAAEFTDRRALNFSIGCYRVTDKSLAASAVYDRAFIAKQSVKGRYDERMAYFDEDMLEKLIRDQSIVNAMETAIAERQFEVWFQPQYNHVTQSLTGAEALVRWRHPQKGIISPGEFIPLFEHNGFIYELDKYVWKETCAYLRKWIDAGLNPLPVSVNISRYDIFRADLIDTLKSCIAEYDIPVELLRLEITESAFAKSTKSIVDIVKQFIALGFTVEIDDFGSGYSSLNTLKSVPAQVVKLDMRFLEDDDNSQRGGNIIESIVRMTKWLGVTVIAEGVETGQQSEFLKSIGCVYVQGYLYAKPMPADKYAELLTGSRREECLPVLETAGNLNNNAFWDPNSMDSLIFNSYVGAACVFEYHNGKTEMLRATEKYAKMLGDGMTVEMLLRIQASDYLDRESAESIGKKLIEAINESGEATDELCFVGLPGCEHRTYVRAAMRVIARTDDRFLIYCISENTTAEHIYAERERKTAKLLQTVLDNINCGVTAITYEDGKRKFMLANDKFYELFGYTRSQYDAEVKNFSDDILRQEDRARTEAAIEQVASTRKPAGIEYRAKRRDGKIIWIRSLLSATSFEDAESPVRLCTYVDITVDKLAAQNLLDNLPCGAGICKIDGDSAQMVYLNRRYYEYFKHDTRSQRDKSVFDAVHPDDHQKLRNAMAPAIQRGAEGSCVVRIADGDEYISFRLAGVAVDSGEGCNDIYVTFMPVYRDELSMNEMLLAALEKIITSSTDLSFVKGCDLRYICCSRTFARMVGIENEKDIVGKTDFDIFEKTLAEKYITDDRKLLADGKSITGFVENLPSEDGRPRFVNTSKYPLFNANGEVIGLYGTGQDITHTRETESRQKFLINSIPGGISVCTVGKRIPQDIKLVYFSDGYCSLFGYNREEYEERCRINPISLVDADYIPGFISRISELVTNGTPIDYIYRAHGKNNIERWVHIKAVIGERTPDKLTVNSMLFDVTEHQMTLERLRMSEEENRLAIIHSGNVVGRYDIASGTLTLSAKADAKFGVEGEITDIPDGQIAEGRISPETCNTYREFYCAIRRGEKSCTAVYQRRASNGWRWIEARSSTIFSGDGKPVSAVITYSDVTDDFEKEIAYKKWMASLHKKDPSLFSLFRCNLNKKTVFEKSEGTLLDTGFTKGNKSFDEHTAAYALQFVHKDDREEFIDFLNADALLEKYYLGERIVSLEFREMQPDGYRWLRLTVDMVEYAHLTDIEAYLLFENIDAVKRAELLTIERAETDSLTGLLNRATFREKANTLLLESGSASVYSLFLLDIDGFKLVNDTFGHATGDKIIADIAHMLRKLANPNDLVGRLGGDEFLILSEMANGVADAEVKAERICGVCRRVLSNEVSISTSVGISTCPEHGLDFNALYEKADRALYHVKGTGKNGYAFFRDGMKNEHSPLQPEVRSLIGGRKPDEKHRMLIVDDSEIDYQLLANIFRGEYIIERADNGKTALAQLRHFGSGISVVLLDLFMPETDGFAVLDEMYGDPELQFIPVVVVSSADERETCLRVIHKGASDFVTKPIDAELIRLRVRSAVSKAENEKLRLRNGFLEMRNAGAERYYTVLEKLGLAVVEIDWKNGTFVYSSNIGRYIAGRFDNRALWYVMLSDMTADAADVRKLQQYVHALAGDRNRHDGSIKTKLKTPSGKYHVFEIAVYKRVNEYGMAKRIILTFKDTESET